MEDFKIENFESENGKGTFPFYAVVSAEEAERVNLLIKSRLNLPEGSTDQALVMEVEAKSIIIESINLLESTAHFSNVVKRLELDSTELVYLNWENYKSFDEMRLCNFVLHIDDIWYPGCDDLDIVDPQGRWVISIHHSGYIKWLQL